MAHLFVFCLFRFGRLARGRKDSWDTRLPRGRTSRVLLRGSRARGGFGLLIFCWRRREGGRLLSVFCCRSTFRLFGFCLFGSCCAFGDYRILGFVLVDCCCAFGVEV